MQKARLFIAERPLRANAVFVDDDDFARLDFANELGVDEIERARFRGENVSAIEFAQDERTPAERIAHGDRSRVRS